MNYTISHGKFKYLKSFLSYLYPTHCFKETHENEKINNILSELNLGEIKFCPK